MTGCRTYRVKLLGSGRWPGAFVSRSGVMMKRETEAGRSDSLWNKFRSSQLWLLLRRIPLLRSGLYLAIELRQTLRERHTSSLEMIDGDFARCNDPWNYETSPLEKARFLK